LWYLAHEVFSDSISQNQIVVILERLLQFERIGVLWSQVRISGCPGIRVQVKDKRIKIIVSRAVDPSAIVIAYLIIIAYFLLYKDAWEKVCIVAWRSLIQCYRLSLSDSLFCA